MGKEAKTEEKETPSESPHIQRNFILKVRDKNQGDIKKALKEQGIELISIVEIHKEIIDS